MSSKFRALQAALEQVKEAERQGASQLEAKACRESGPPGNSTVFCAKRSKLWQSILVSEYPAMLCGLFCLELSICPDWNHTKARILTQCLESASRGCWPGQSHLSQTCAEFLQVNILIEAQIQLQAAEDEKKKAPRKNSWGWFLFPTQMSHPMTFWGPVSLAALGQPRLSGRPMTPEYQNFTLHSLHNSIVWFFAKLRSGMVPGREGEPWWHCHGCGASGGTELRKSDGCESTAGVKNPEALGCLIWRHHWGTISLANDHFLGNPLINYSFFVHGWHCPPIPEWFLQKMTNTVGPGEQATQRFGSDFTRPRARILLSMRTRLALRTGGVYWGAVSSHFGWSNSCFAATILSIRTYSLQFHWPSTKTTRLCWTWKQLCVFCPSWGVKSGRGQAEYDMSASRIDALRFCCLLNGSWTSPEDLDFDVRQTAASYSKPVVFFSSVLISTFSRCHSCEQRRWKSHSVLGDRNHPAGEKGEACDTQGIPAGGKQRSSWPSSPLSSFWAISICSSLLWVCIPMQLVSGEIYRKPRLKCFEDFSEAWGDWDWKDIGKGRGWPHHKAGSARPWLSMELVFAEGSGLPGLQMLWDSLQYTTGIGILMWSWLILPKWYLDYHDMMNLLKCWENWHRAKVTLIRWPLNTLQRRARGKWGSCFSWGRHPRNALFFWHALQFAQFWATSISQLVFLQVPTANDCESCIARNSSRSWSRLRPAGMCLVASQNWVQMFDGVLGIRPTRLLSLIWYVVRYSHIH